MLVLTRKHREHIIISNDIKVTVLRVKGNTVRLGIEAPDHVRIMRGELNEKASQVGAATVSTNEAGGDGPVGATMKLPPREEAGGRRSVPLSKYVVGCSAI